MPFGFGKKDRDGRRNKGRGRRFGLGRKRASFEPECRHVKCICPECGLSVPHQHRVQCFKLKCPQCGSPMTRSFSDA